MALLEPMPRDELLRRVSMLCAREITKFGDLEPIEVEAICRDLFRPEPELVQLEKLWWCAEHRAVARQPDADCPHRVQYVETPSVGMTTAPCRLQRLFTRAPDVDVPDGQIAPATAAIHNSHGPQAEVELSFGPYASVASTDNEAGIEFHLWKDRHARGVAIVRLRVSFDRGIYPSIDLLEVHAHQRTEQP